MKKKITKSKKVVAKKVAKKKVMIKKKSVKKLPVKKVSSKKSLKKNVLSKRKTTMTKKKVLTIPPLRLPLVGSIAPMFVLPDQFGAMEALEHQRGKWVLLYFYPKDDTPGCTKEACAIRDGFPFFEKLDIVVFGISIDSVKSHAKFAEKYKLPFTLLSDEQKDVVNAYGVWGMKRFMGRSYMGTNRVSFVIDPNGKIAKVYPDVSPATHADEVLADLKLLQGK